ncbi:MAG TPA: hypothetical protein ENK21_02400 [Trueperaceae bacterium]|nr:hypothetical protein [Trueperaceae bacterium]
MKPFLLLQVILISLSFAFAQDTANPVVIDIDGQEITKTDFDERFSFFISDMAAKQNMQLPLTEEAKAALEELKPAFLEQFLTEQVVLKLAKERGYELPEGYVDAQLQNLKDQFDDEESYQQGIIDAGIPSEDFLKNLIKEAYLSSQVVTQMRDDLEIPDWRVELYYATHADEFKSPEQACARHILVETEEEALDIIKQLKDGAGFSEMAKEHSLDPGSGSRGGDLGCFPRGAMVPSFNDAAFSLELNTVSEPIKSQFGYHIISVSERKEAGTIDFDQVKEQVREKLRNDILLKIIKTYQDVTPITVNEELLFGAKDATEGN